MVRLRAFTLVVALVAAASAAHAGNAPEPLPPPLQLSPMVAGNHELWVPELEGTWRLDYSGTGPVDWEWIPTLNPPAWIGTRELTFRRSTGNPLRVRPNGTVSVMTTQGPIGNHPFSYSWDPIAVTGAPAAGGSVAYDPTRDQVVMVGPLGQVSILSFSDPGPSTWTTLPVTAPFPAAQVNAAIVVDEERDQLVLAGGGTPCPNIYNSIRIPVASAWRMPLAGPYTWTALPDVPFVGEDSDLLVDAVLDRLLWVGGHYEYDPSCSGDRPIEGWAGSAWALPLGVPSPTWSPKGGFYDPYGFTEPAAATFDSTRGLIALGGKYIGSGMYRDYAVRNVLIAPPGPFLNFAELVPGAYDSEYPQVAFDAAHQRLFRHGGFGPSSDYGDYSSKSGLQVWEDWAWEPKVNLVAPSGAPSLYDGSAIVTRTGDLVIFGGAGQGSAPVSPSVPQNKTHLYSYDSNTWTTLAVGGSLPIPRIGAAVAYDPALHRLLVYGGFGNTAPPEAWPVLEPRSDLWALDLTTLQWTEAHPTGFTPLAGRVAAAWDPSGGRMMFTGENAGGNVVVWSLDAALTQYTEWVVGGTAPDHAYSCAVDPHLQRLIVLDDSITVWSMPLAGPPEWTRVSSSKRPFGAGRLFFGFESTRGIAVYGGPAELFRVDVRAPADEVTGVPEVPAHARLSLRVVGRHPASRPMLELALPRADHARLELFDLAGRRVWARDLGGLGAGLHRVPAGEGAALAAGVYSARLIQNGEQRTAKMVVLP
jgi:hypothetical protein